MKFGITLLSIIPIRKEPDDRSEMTSQLLFGEHFKILNIKHNWAFIETSFDSYKGWVDERMITGIKPDTFNALNSDTPFVINRKTVNLKLADMTFQQVFAGSNIPFLNKSSKRFTIESRQFEISEKLNTSDFKSIRPEISDISLLYYNSPYLWGGRTPCGIDCSGFTQIVYKICGLKLPRNAAQQAGCGQALKNLDKSQTGDLGFFTKMQSDEITHTGILLKDNKIIHASGKVRIDTIDEKGIFNEDINTYTHRLVSIRKVINEQ